MSKQPTTKGSTTRKAPATITPITAPVTQRTVKLAHLLARITAENIKTLPKAS